MGFLSGLFGGGDNTSTATTGPAAWVAPYLSKTLKEAQRLAKTPFQPYTGDRFEDFSPDQLAAFGAVRDAQGSADPYFNAAFGAATTGGGPVTWEQVQAAYNPAIDAHVAALQNDFGVQNERALQDVQSRAVKAGGSDSGRLIAQQLASESQRRTQDATLAGVRSDAMNRAWQGAEGNRDAAARNASVLGSLGAQYQGSQYADANALLQSGGMQQGFGQQQADFDYEQNRASVRHPWEANQYMLNAVGMTAPLAGSTSSSTTPGPSAGSQILGAGATILGGWLSDERIKEDKVQVGELFDGTPVHRFRYLGDPRTQIGVMAQEVERKNPEAVAEIGGIKMVDYDKATRPAMQVVTGGMGPDMGGWAGGSGDPDMDRITKNLVSATKAIKEASRGGRMGYAPGGSVEPAMRHIPAGFIPTDGFQPSGGLPAAPIMAPSTEASAGPDFSKLGGQIGKWAQRKFGSPIDMGQGSWAPTITFASHGGRMGERMGYAPGGLVGPRGFGLDEEIDVPAPGYIPDAPSVAGMRYAAPEVSPEARMEPASATAPESSEAPASGKSWWEPGSNPQLGQALMAAGLATMGGDSPHAMVNIGRGGLAGLQAYMTMGEKQRAEALEKRKIDAEAQRYADQLERQTAANLEAARHNRAVESRPTDDIAEYEYALKNGFTGSFDAFLAKKGTAPRTDTDDIREYEYARQGGYAGSFEDFIAKKGKSTTDTDDMREYNFAVGQGFKGNFMDFMRSKKTSLGDDPVIARAEAKAALKDIGEKTEMANVGRQTLSDIEQMRGYRAQVGYEGGWFPGLRTGVGKVAGGVLGRLPGVPSSEEAGAAEAIQSKALELQLAFTNKTKGAISDAEMRMFGGATPGLNMTDIAADQVMMGMEVAALRAVEQQKFYENFYRKHGTTMGAGSAWDDFVNTNKVFDIDPKTKKMTINRANVSNWKSFIDDAPPEKESGHRHSASTSPEPSPGAPLPPGQYRLNDKGEFEPAELESVQ